MDVEGIIKEYYKLLYAPKFENQVTNSLKDTHNK